MNAAAFTPESALFEGKAHPDCMASVILPARNEEDSLPATLDAFAAQVSLDGHALPPDSFELIVLLNNCTDSSSAVVAHWQAMHPHIVVHRVSCTLHDNVAHVGTARRMLMDTAWRRLQGVSSCIKGILSTDSDTLVAPNWIAQNLCALSRGADAVGGVIKLQKGDLEVLPEGVRRAYLMDRRYQLLIAQLESILDPQAGDPWPRHLEHFGASLACTPAIYARAGGMPAVKPLEDVAFVDALRRVDARLRHAPEVMVYTSSRFDGRVDVGLSYQLKMWQRMSEDGEQHLVPSAAWLHHRFTSLQRLRILCSVPRTSKVTGFSVAWCERITQARRIHNSIAQFLGAIDCDRLIEETFRGKREESISQANRKLANSISQHQVSLDSWSYATESIASVSLLRV